MVKSVQTKKKFLNAKCLEWLVPHEVRAVCLSIGQQGFHGIAVTADVVFFIHSPRFCTGQTTDFGLHRSAFKSYDACKQMNS